MSIAKIAPLIFGLFLVLTVDKSAGFFLPWYLHLFFGLFLIIYWSLIYFKDKKKSKILPILILAITTFLTYYKISFTSNQTNKFNDGSHPYWDSESIELKTTEDILSGVIKLKDDRIYIQLNQTSGLSFDSINVLLGNELLTSDKVFLTSIIDEGGRFLRGTTSKKPFKHFEHYLLSKDTLRIGLQYNNDLFKDLEKNIQIKFYFDSSYLITEKIE